MNRVGVFYSVGPHFRKALEAARELGDRVVAVAPRGTEVGDLADEQIETEFAHYTPRMIRENLRLVSKLRGERFDGFVVLFDSAQLMILASLVRAQETWYCAPHGRLTRLHGSATGIALREVLLRLRGWALYGWLSIYVRMARVSRSSADRRATPRR